jgi:hypothetical protein
MIGGDVFSNARAVCHNCARYSTRIRTDPIASIAARWTQQMRRGVSSDAAAHLSRRAHPPNGGCVANARAMYVLSFYSPFFHASWGKIRKISNSA